ncbi:MAG: diguanylate cyclase domain-containing protein, partial [Janthinobacterium lividum]
MSLTNGQSRIAGARWPEPEREAERLAELTGYHINNAPEPDFDHIVELASDLLDVPIALINLVHHDHLQVKARVGIELETVPRQEAFCSHTILSRDGLMVPDASHDERFAHSEIVAGPSHVRFYAGVPLCGRNGLNLGTLCVFDTKLREALTPKQVRLMKRLAELVVDKLELRRLQRTDVITSKLVNATSEAFLCVGDDGIITYWNAAAEKMFGLPQEVAVGKPVEIIVPERFRGAHAMGFARVANGGTSKLAGRPVELAALRANGDEFPVELLISVWEHDNRRGMGAIMRDLSSRKQHEKQLDFLAHYDQLTGLLNRYYFCELVDEAIMAGKQVSLLLIDINGFRTINDDYGYDRGDTLLQSFAIRIAACLDLGMQFARMSGDDFAVLVIGTSAAAYELALSVQIAAAEPFDL